MSASAQLLCQPIIMSKLERSFSKMRSEEGMNRKLLRQNLRARQGFARRSRTRVLAGLGMLAAGLLGVRALRKKGAAPAAPAPSPDETAALREVLEAHSRELLRLDHALRTPIGAATAALALLDPSNEDAQLQAEARQVIARQLARMTALTEELRDIARLLTAEDHCRARQKARS